MQNSYLEPLLDDCPPEESEEIIAPRIVFRLVRNNPPTIADFRSQRAERPNREFRGISECQARGLSVHTDFRASENLLKLPQMRGRTVCQVALDSGAGYIQQTGNNLHHCTCWPLANYDILGNCSIGE